MERVGSGVLVNELLGPPPGIAAVPARMVVACAARLETMLANEKYHVAQYLALCEEARAVAELADNLAQPLTECHYADR